MAKILIAITFSLVITIVFPYGVNAQDFTALFQHAAEKKGVSYKLAMAIAKHESGMNPFAVNVAGKGYMPKTRDEATNIIKVAQQKGLSYDVELMQINNQWPRRWKIDPLTLLDPETNIDLGITILAREIDTKGFSWAAVGAYHSPDPTRSKSYAWRIYNLAMGKNKKPSVKIKEKRVKEAANAHEVKTAPILLYRGGATKNTSSRGERRFIRF